MVLLHCESNQVTVSYISCKHTLATYGPAALSATGNPGTVDKTAWGLVPQQAHNKDSMTYAAEMS
jgi:hypothetical protein